MQRIAAGDLTSRIIIEQKAQTPRATGPGYTESWTEWGRLAAKVHPASGQERFEADQVQDRALYRFTVRRRTDLTADMRIRWNDEIYNIRFIGLTARTEQFMTIDAERGELD
ncbi:phage head closure protein [Nisaea nitritireducens]|uniref:phage head closure protein n=1 Tax=Nisaea nitritireducens TaxID=568392 RepID=UPI0018678C29|nr:phage head closure protein [Nisaea nitritireducens]